MTVLILTSLLFQQVDYYYSDCKFVTCFIMYLMMKNLIINRLPLKATQLRLRLKFVTCFMMHLMMQLVLMLVEDHLHMQRKIFSFSLDQANFNFLLSSVSCVVNRKKRSLEYFLIKLIIIRWIC